MQEERALVQDGAADVPLQGARERRVLVDIPDGRPVTAAFVEPEAAPLSAVVLGHGAALDVRSPFMVAARRGLAMRGHAVLSFNFPYAEEGRERPDRPELLAATVQAAAARLRSEVPGVCLVLAGKSLGARAASLAVAHGEQAEGLLFFGYPLHAPARPGLSRTEHWSQLHLPALFLEGTRDPMCELPALRVALAEYAGQAQVVEIEGGDHSFELPRGSVRSQADVYEELWDAADVWLRHVCTATS